MVILFLKNQVEHQSYEQAVEANKNSEEEAKARIRNNITSYVTAERSAYNYSSLGGISNLSISVSNSTNYLMDKVQVKVIYIKANGEVWDTKIIDFDLLEPNTKKTIRVEDTNRGVSVQYEFASIHSTALNL